MPAKMEFFSALLGEAGITQRHRCLAEQNASVHVSTTFQRVYMGVSIIIRDTRIPLVIIHFNGIFPNKNHLFLGTPMTMETSICNSLFNVTIFMIGIIEIITSSSDSSASGTICIIETIYPVI